MKGLTICPICERSVSTDRTDDKAIYSVQKSQWYHGPCARFAHAEKKEIKPLSDQQKIEAVSQKLGGPITNSFEAFWFLHDHPQFIRAERDELTPEEANEFKENKFYRLIKDEGGNFWRECKKLNRHAINENLDIFYTRTDETGHINDDCSKNTNIECWLEFGQVSWGYYYNEQAKREKARCVLQNYHDYELDAGGSTFDEALIELANNALKKYGPIPKD
jgi:hypothetical protein